MWLMFALCIGSAGGVFIQLKAEDLSCEDPMLERLLQKPNVTLPPPPKNHYPDTFLFALENHEKLLAQKARRADRIKNMPEPLELKDRVLDLMRHHIYVTQRRLKHLDRVTNKFHHDVSYRMGFVFSRLDTILVDMRVLLTRIWRTIKERDKPIKTDNQPFYDHVINYTYMTKKSVDVIYIVEYLIRLHTRTMHKNFPTTERAFTAANLPTKRRKTPSHGGGPGGAPGGGPGEGPGKGPGKDADASPEEHPDHQGEGPNAHDSGPVVTRPP